MDKNRHAVESGELDIPSQEYKTDQRYATVFIRVLKKSLNEGGGRGEKRGSRQIHNVHVVSLRRKKVPDQCAQRPTKMKHVSFCGKLSRRGDIFPFSFSERERERDRCWC